MPMIKIYFKAQNGTHVHFCEVEGDDCIEKSNNSVVIIQDKSFLNKVEKDGKTGEKLESALNKVILKFSDPIIKIDK